MLSTIFGPPYLKSCYWLGITDFDNFIQPFISPKIYRKDLEITVAWLKQGFSFSHLSYYLDCNPITLRQKNFAMLEQLAPWASEQVYFPLLSEWHEMTPPGLWEEYKTLFFFVDGTVIQIWKPKDSKTN